MDGHKLTVVSLRKPHARCECGWGWVSSRLDKDTDHDVLRSLDSAHAAHLYEVKHDVSARKISTTKMG